MSKRNLLMAAVAIVLTFAAMGCKKATIEPTQEAAENGKKESTTETPIPFEGTWKLTIVTDSVQNNGTWFKNETLPEGNRIPTRYGRLTVTKNGDKYDVLARIAILNDSVDYYNTTAEYIERDCKLVLNSGNDYQSYKGPMHFTFQPWELNQGKFKVDAEYEAHGAKIVERATNYVE